MAAVAPVGDCWLVFRGGHRPGANGNHPAQAVPERKSDSAKATAGLASDWPSRQRGDCRTRRTDQPCEVARSNGGPLYRGHSAPFRFVKPAQVKLTIPSIGLARTCRLIAPCRNSLTARCGLADCRQTIDPTLVARSPRIYFGIAVSDASRRARRRARVDWRHSVRLDLPGGLPH